jgi:hypothetical protein
MSATTFRLPRSQITKSAIFRSNFPRIDQRAFRESLPSSGQRRPKRHLRKYLVRRQGTLQPVEEFRLVAREQRFTPDTSKPRLAGLQKQCGDHQDNQRDAGRDVDWVGENFRKLVRLCEEIDAAYGLRCYYATAMVIRGLLDHVPPVFGCKTFSEVANNYAGGGRSFKETMLHLENASRKVGDAHLQMPIRKSETLPTAQQVNCGQQFDVLLSEIVRITQ